MEASSTDKESGTKSIMKVTDVNAHTNVKFSMGDYQITNFGNITIPQE
jgi:hypothetical protein